MLVELQAQRLPVQIAVKVQEAGLHGDVRAVVQGGTDAHVGDGGVICPVRQAGPGDVHPVAGHQHMGRDRQIGSGKQAGGPHAPPVADGPRQGVGMAQKPGGPLHLPQLNEAADIGGADGDVPNLHLGDDVAPQAQLPALGLEELRRTLVFVAEAVVVARRAIW